MESEKFFNVSRSYAIVLMLIISLISSYWDMKKGNSGVSPSLYGVYFGFSIVYCFWSVWLVAAMRGALTYSATVNDVKVLNTWGYIWRSWLLCLFSTIVTMFIIKGLLGINFYKTDFTQGIYFSVLEIVVIPLLCWVIFSTNRKMQLLGALKMVRGY